MANSFLGNKTRAAYWLKDDIQIVHAESLHEGVTQFDRFVAYKSGDDVRFYDRVCDHNGGNLISTTENQYILRCPLHDWRMDVSTGKYLNVAHSKLPLKAEYSNETYRVNLPKRGMEWPADPQQKRTTLTFLNHACFVVELGNELSFATDPWVIGSAFCDGWWLSEPSPVDAIERLRRCDFIFVSHNHPDHLHAETLLKLPVTTRFVIPKFSNDSVGRYLQSLGFTDIHRCDFGDVYDFNVDGFRFCILKSGDFRDDSGIVFSYGDFLSVMSVDCNALNNYVLPKDVTVLAASFAGGATGFPICFGNLDETEKRRIVARNRNTMLNSVDNYVGATSPSYFIPYAGYFKEDQERDAYVAERNKKNSPSDIERHLAKRNLTFVNPLDSRVLTFEGHQLKSRGTLVLDGTDPDRRTQYARSEQTYGNVSDAEIQTYFDGAQFRADIVLYLTLCGEEFQDWRKTFKIDFRKETPGCRRLDRRPDIEEIRRDDGVNRVLLDVREPAFGRIVRDYLPWEDFLIGFQSRIHRWPDVYNSDMWYYFTNQYIVDFARKTSLDCGQVCERLNQETF